LSEPWRPERDGFEFSSSDLASGMARRELLQLARGQQSQPPPRFCPPFSRRRI